MATLQSVRDRARAAVAQGDYSLAHSLIELIHRHFPSDLESTRLLGRIQLARGRRAEAREAFLMVLQADPESVAARSALALLAEEEGELDWALEQLERAFALDSGNSRVAEEVGSIRSRLSHTSPVDPGSSEHALARLLVRQRRYSAAARLFQAALRRSPERQEVASGLAESLWLSGRRDEAEAAAATVLSSLPNSLRMLAILAGASFVRGEVEALFLLRKISESDPGNSVARRLFVDAGLPFPRVGVDAEIPGAEVARVLAAAGRGSARGQADEDPWEEWDEEEEPEPFFMPEDQLEGEWIRGKGIAPMAPHHGGPEPSDPWAEADVLASSGQFQPAIEQYMAILRDMRQSSPTRAVSATGERSTVEKEQDGTNSGDRQARRSAAWSHRRVAEEAGNPRSQAGWPEDDGG